MNRIGYWHRPCPNCDETPRQTNVTDPYYLYELHQLHPIFTLWSASEPELNPVLLALASAGERSAQAQHQVLVTYTPIIVQPLKEYLLYVEAVKETLTRRDSVQIEYELTQEELNKRRLEKDQVKLILYPKVIPINSLRVLTSWVYYTPSVPSSVGSPINLGAIRRSSGDTTWGGILSEIVLRLLSHETNTKAGS
ncbi:unnamed protein product [Timema podura]|uniref:Uncharacterized protein n=1 Tax=Timema podura TaxID=61482 RepID=A0ABN7PJB6_TIMPD|nr:unnamed protein product [Timema podura]